MKLYLSIERSAPISQTAPLLVVLADALLLTTTPAAVGVVTGGVVITGAKLESVQNPAAYATKAMPCVLYALRI